ncbi:MAG TPA: hypothetical protein VF849_01475 [Blattabacteriaceae bacterium]
MSIQILAPIRSDNILELQEWVRFYDINGKYPANILERFAIGIYQIKDGMEWKDTLNKNESWCAAFIHFLTVAEKLNLPIEDKISLSLPAFGAILNENLLLNLSRAQQDIFYKYNSGKTQRSSRYNSERLTINLSKVLSICYCKVPKEERPEGFYNASSIMIGKL